MDGDDAQDVSLWHELDCEEESDCEEGDEEHQFHNLKDDHEEETEAAKTDIFCFHCHQTKNMECFCPSSQHMRSADCKECRSKRYNENKKRKRENEINLDGTKFCVECEETKL